MRSFLTLILSVACFANSTAMGAEKPVAKAAAATVFNQKTTLQVTSYNIKGLPSFLLGTDYQDSRYPLIGKLLAGPASSVTGTTALATGPEIVLLQEAFSDQTPLLLASAGFPHSARGPAATSVLGVDSGLYILSRYPIVEQAERAFGKEHCLSWDCMANKGVQFARIAVPGLPKPVEVYNTHLQAGREDSAARRAQVKVLLEFFQKHHQTGSPVIFAGDFNFRPGLGQQSYLDFSNGTKFTHAGKFCLDNGCSQSPDEGWHGVWARAVDHQFFRTGEGMEVLPLSVKRTYREPVEGLRLSDHPAHEVRYEFRWNNVTVAQEPGVTVIKETKK